MNVTVINPFRVTQTGAYTFTMSTADKLEKAPEKKDIMVKQEGSEIDNAIKDVKLSEDKMSIEVMMEIPFIDQKKYEVTFGKNKDSFVASVGAPATINIKTQTAVANKATKVEYAVLDAKGMDVTKTLDESKLSLSVTVKNGFYDDKKKEVTIFKTGDTAEAKVVYHTWTYDQKTGKENVVEGKGTITAVDKSSVTVVGIDKYTIGETVLSWDTDEMISMMPQNKSKKIFVRMKKSDGSYVDNLGKEKNNFKFSATDSATVTVNDKGNIYSYRQGLAYVKVVYLDFNVKYEYTLPVTVGAPSTPSSMTLAPEYVTVNKGGSVHTPVILQVKDQYNEVWDPESSTVKFEHLNGEKIVPENAAGDVTGIKELSRTDKNIRLGVIAKDDTGVGTYKITFKEPGVELNKVLTVNSVEVNASIEPSYSLRPMDTTDMEVTLTENSLVKDINDLTEGISFQLYETKANVITGNANKIITKYIDSAKERETYIILDGYRRLISNKDFDLTKFSSDVIAIDADGSKFTIKPLIKDGNNVLLTLGDGTHTLTITFYVPINSKNLSEGYKKVSLSSSFTVSNKTKAGVEDEDYIVKNKKVSAPATAKGIADVVIKAKNNASIGVDTWTKDWFYALSSGRALWTNTTPKNVSPKETAGKLSIEPGKHYNLDTAPIPAFETEEKEGGRAIQVWTLRDKRSIDVEYNVVSGSGASTPSTSPAELTNIAVTPSKAAAFTETLDTSGTSKVANITITGKHLSFEAVKDHNQWLSESNKFNITKVENFTTVAGKPEDANGITKATVDVTVTIRPYLTITNAADDAKKITLVLNSKTEDAANAITVATCSITATTKAMFDTANYATGALKEVTITFNPTSLVKDYKNDLSKLSSYVLENSADGEYRLIGTPTLDESAGTVKIKIERAKDATKSIPERAIMLSISGKSIKVEQAVETLLDKTTAPALDWKSAEPVVGGPAPTAQLADKIKLTTAGNWEIKSIVASGEGINTDNNIFKEGEVKFVVTLVPKAGYEADNATLAGLSLANGWTVNNKENVLTITKTFS